MSGDELIWFCSCHLIPEGGYCYKHRRVSEEVRLKARDDVNAMKAVKAAADKIGWVGVLKRVTDPYFEMER